MVCAILPAISISPAPPEDPLVEPHSPFSWSLSSPVDEDDDGFRPRHLTPPPSHLTFKKPHSPLRPMDVNISEKGLEQDRFEALLKASRERNASFGSKKTNDLRKEIALKAHKTKQVERRALFLSKVLAPPSPTATSLPKTPPDSPAIFHYTLPSPGLVSPLALFDSLNERAFSGEPPVTCAPWVEQVDFRRPNQTSPRKKESVSGGLKSAGNLPSLDQISARLGGQILSSSFNGEGRMPAFLQARNASKERPKLILGVGRLQMPLRDVKAKPANLMTLPPRSPLSPMHPDLEVTTLVVPRSSTLSPVELSESNLLALDSRERRAHDMMSTLRRRGLPSDHGLNGHDEEEERKFRRHSAPAEFSKKPRTGFEHPVLSMPGGF